MASLRIISEQKILAFDLQLCVVKPMETGMVDFEKFAIIEIDIYQIGFSGFVFRFRYNFENIEKLQFDIFQYKIQPVLFR